jgi:small subunit ribosomal protein S20
MANIKQQKKRNRKNEEQRQRNMTIRSRMRTYLKNADSAIEAKDPEKIKSTLQEALSQVDRAATKGVIHRNSAARKKSSLERRAAASLK